jgi:outer membrane receptor protein involved in Fe transport
MKKSISVLLFLFLIVFSSFGQEQKNILRGKVQDSENNILPGASVIVVGTKYGVNANEDGEYLLDQVPQGKITIQTSYVGYQTRTIDFEVQAGENTLNFNFEKADVKLAGITVTSQKREQQMIDVPITMSVVDARFMEDLNLNELDEIAGFVPGMQVRMQGVDRPSIVVRGLTSDEVSPTAQPRVSVFYNNVPISRTNGASVALFDMQQVEVLKGPQGTLFGRGAQIGAIHYISKKATSDFGGFVNAGFGNYNQKELNGAINIPIIKNKLMVRAAGIYDYQDGYITNTFGGKLNGKNTAAGRFSSSYLPSVNDKIDVVVNYQKDDNPGLGFMSMNYPNTDGSKDPFKYVASLDQGKKLATNRDIFDATLTARHYINENSFWTSTSSYRKIDAFSRWDGDGTAAAAIDMSETDGARQFYQEIRYNYSVKNKLNGSIGASYWNEKASQDYWFSPNEQNLVHLFLNTGYLVTPDGQPYPMATLPNDPQLGQLAGFPLMTDHQETSYNNGLNQALEEFADANYQLTSKLSLTGGIRVSSEWFKLTNQAQMTGGNPATLGFLTGNYPNVFFKSGESKEISESTVSFTWRGGLKYAFSENSSLYAGYAKGRRPEVLQYTSTGEPQVLDPEIVNSYDLGYKTAINQKIWFDLGAFYHDYSNFQTSAWVADATTGEFNYLVKDGGKATAYGAEANIRYSMLKGLQIFGNYAYIHARFADTDADGMKQEYANHQFRLTPDHSFAIGLNARIKITQNLYLFGIPSYVYQTKIFFEDANTAGLEQSAYGLLNFRAGVELPEQRLTVSVWGSNLLDEKYIVSAGNTGSLFGDPTQIPGAPRMFGTKISWKF